MIKKLVTLLLLALVVIFGLGAFVWWNQHTGPVSTNSESQTFLITKGSGAIKVANNLEEQKLIKSSLAFRVYTKLTGQEGRIQAGVYELSPSANLFQIVAELLKGPKEVWVTIPEGLRREEIAQRFIDGFSLKGQVAEDFRQQFLDASEGKEGFLFPDTYRFPKTTSAEKVVNALLTTFDTKYETVAGNPPSGFTLNEVVTLASLLERETITEEEKPLVVGIILNRLENDWPLQIDAAVQYAIANRNCKTTCNDWWPEISRADLDIVSPYNTYKNQGLPPGPIASPGLSSIQAVLNPQESDYFFYLHDARGKIYYAETLEEHNENVRKYLGK